MYRMIPQVKAQVGLNTITSIVTHHLVTMDMYIELKEVATEITTVKNIYFKSLFKTLEMNGFLVEYLDLFKIIDDDNKVKYYLVDFNNNLKEYNFA